MSQNLRVALWVPMVDPAEVGNVIRTTAAPDVLTKKIPSEFAVAGTGSGGGGVVFATRPRSPRVSSPTRRFRRPRCAPS